MIMACLEKPIQAPLQNLAGSKGAFDTIKRVMGFKSFAAERDLSRNPIALTPCGHIYRDHFQLAGAYLAGKFSIGTITKKIPCDFEVFDRNWAVSHFSPKNLELLDNYYNELLEELRNKF